MNQFQNHPVLEAFNVKKAFPDWAVVHGDKFKLMADCVLFNRKLCGSAGLFVLWWGALFERAALAGKTPKVRYGA